MKTENGTKFLQSYDKDDNEKKKKNQHMKKTNYKILSSYW